MRIFRSHRSLISALLIATGITLFNGCQGVAPTRASGSNGGSFLSMSSSTLSFGSVQKGKSSSLSETVTNTGRSALTISQASISATEFSVSAPILPAAISPNESVTFTVTFAPTAAGSFSGTLAVVSTANNSPLNVTLSGTGTEQGQLSVSPTLSFGNVAVGTRSSLGGTLQATGSSVTISGMSLESNEFALSGLSLPTTLAADQTISFTVTFAPTAAGSFSGTLAVVSTANNSPLNVTLSGTGTEQGQLLISPTLSFGNVVVGTRSSLDGTLQATGSSVTISGMSLESNEFALSGFSLPTTLAADQTTSFTVTFEPVTVGKASATLSFSSDAATSPTTQALTGNGISAPQHSVALTWDASKGPDVVGYNVYRGISGGPYSRINSALETGTAFTDNTVTSGETYYYVTTAVDGSGLESAYSNRVKAVIPAQ